MGKIKAFFLHLFFPNRCVCCDEFIEYDGFLCEECKKKLPFAEEYPLKNCVDFLLDGFSTPFYYKDGIDDCVRDLKFRGVLRNADFLAHYMAESVMGKDEFSEADVIIPVPLHKKDKRRRGYNQSFLLAKKLSKALGIPAEKDALQKVKHTKKQHKLSYSERISNVEKAFAVGDKSAVLGKKVILVDDVFTTGSTMKNCAEALKSAGASRVLGLTAAKTDFRGKINLKGDIKEEDYGEA